MRRAKVKIPLRLLNSKRATALPISFLMLFVSLTVIVSATYYTSVTKIQSRGKILNISVAKQNMLSFENSIGFTKWAPGTSSVFTFEDSGGTFETDGRAKHLKVNITDNNTFNDLVFNSSVGKAVYQLPSAAISVSTLYLIGDNRGVINQSVFTMAQLSLAPASPSPALTLAYRPLVTMSETGTRAGKPVNTLRLYIISLNSSANITAIGKFSIKATCLNVTSTIQTYNLTSQVTAIFVTTSFNGRSDRVALQVSSNADGAFVEVETLVCNIKLERVQGGS